MGEAVETRRDGRYQESLNTAGPGDYESRLTSGGLDVLELTPQNWKLPLRVEVVRALEASTISKISVPDFDSLG